MSNESSEYVLTPDALNDLEDIIDYTIDEWGEEQAGLYTDKLAQCFALIAGRQTIPRRISRRYPQIQFTRCEHHYVFYIYPEHQRATIIAVFHERMNLLQRLRNRLS